MRYLFFLFLLVHSSALYGQVIFQYDTYNLDESSIEEQFDNELLENGTSYTMEVVGTYSIWAASHWDTPCGHVNSTPLFPSVKVFSNGHVGFDFEYIFSYPNTKLCTGRTFPFLPPKPRMEISLDNGKTWFHPVTIDSFNSNHLYTYTVIGRGFPLGVRHLSPENSDDYGVLKFTLNTEERTDTNTTDTLDPGTKDTTIIAPKEPIIVLFEMPNVITPNDDGKNDVFEPEKLVGIKSGQLLIYNRWGQPMNSSSIFTGWDGTFNERECSPAVYYWIATYTDVEGGKGKDQGTLTLIR